MPCAVALRELARFFHRRCGLGKATFCRPLATDPRRRSDRCQCTSGRRGRTAMTNPSGSAPYRSAVTPRPEQRANDRSHDPGAAESPLRSPQTRRQCHRATCWNAGLEQIHLADQPPARDPAATGGAALGGSEADGQRAETPMLEMPRGANGVPRPQDPGRRPDALRRSRPQRLVAGHARLLNRHLAARAARWLHRMMPNPTPGENQHCTPFLFLRPQVANSSRKSRLALHFVRIGARCGDGTPKPAEFLDSSFYALERGRAPVIVPKAVAFNLQTPADPSRGLAAIAALRVGFGGLRERRAPDAACRGRRVAGLDHSPGSCNIALLYFLMLFSSGTRLEPELRHGRRGAG